MKDTLSSLELHYLLLELQFLVGAKLEKVFQQEKPLDEFLFTLHLPSKGKRHLFVTIPKALCLSSFKPIFPTVPPHFCTLLRKRLSNARIKKVEQLAFERIFLIEWSTRDTTYNLIIELLSPGNIVLCDSEKVILAALHPKKWNTRSILPGNKYALPPSKMNPLDVSKKDFFDGVKLSNKESLVKTLAIDLSLGGVYAEELLSRTSISPLSLPSLISEENSNIVYAALQNLLFSPVAARVVNSAAFPFLLSQHKGSGHSAFPTFNEAASSVILNQLEQKDQIEQKKSATISHKKFDKVLIAQEHQLKNMKKASVENQQKGELIYMHYTDLQKFISILATERKTLSWKEIKEKYKDNPIVASFDDSNNTVTLDLPEATL